MMQMAQMPGLFFLEPAHGAGTATQEKALRYLHHLRYLRKNGYGGGLYYAR